MTLSRPLLTGRLRVELIREAHAPALLAYYRENETHLARWEPERPPGFFSVEYWRANAAAMERDGIAERAFNFVALERERTDAIVGQINLWQIVRGVSLSATLGYSLGRTYEGRGLAREAVGAVVGFAFDVLGLHRVRASYQPTNERSGGLLRRLGFVVEGYARDYLYIDGAWRDSVLTSITNPKPVTP